jgi:hypothetical protein
MKGDGGAPSPQPSSTAFCCTLSQYAAHLDVVPFLTIASAGVIVDAKDDSAASFYKKYSFIELSKVERSLFLPMKTIERFFR